MSEIRVNKVIDEAGTGKVELTQGATLPLNKILDGAGGVIVGSAVTATAGFVGDLTGNVTGDATGLTGTPNITVNAITAASGSVSGNFSVAGVLSYEDVTNIDSVGLITARNGIDVLAGISTFQGVDNEKRVTEKINTVSGTAIDCAEGNYFKKTVTGATAFTFTNVPSGTAYFLTIEIECNGSNAVTWPDPNVKWPADTAPSITDGKTTLFMFVTDDGGTRWRGSSLADYTN